MIGLQTARTKLRQDNRLLDAYIEDGIKLLPSQMQDTKDLIQDCRILLVAIEQKLDLVKTP